MTWIIITAILYLLVGGIFTVCVTDECVDSLAEQAFILILWPIFCIGAGVLWIFDKYMSLMRIIVKRWKK